jgi:hypothetical protein
VNVSDTSALVIVSRFHLWSFWSHCFCRSNLFFFFDIEDYNLRSKGRGEHGWHGSSIASLSITHPIFLSSSMTLSISPFLLSIISFFSYATIWFHHCCRFSLASVGWLTESTTESMVRSFVLLCCTVQKIKIFFLTLSLF